MNDNNYDEMIFVEVAEGIIVDIEELKKQKKANRRKIIICVGIGIVGGVLVGVLQNLFRVI